jgi:hypothetical protein
LFAAEVPLGHKYLIPSGGTDPEVTPYSTADGEYFPDWRPRPSSGILSCRTCGTNIKSDSVEPLNTFTLTTTGNEIGFIADTVVMNVPRTTASCCEYHT